MKKNMLKKILIGIIIALCLFGITLFIFFNKKVIIRFMDNNAVYKVMVIDKGDSIDLPTLESDDYIFDGWYIDDEKLDERTFFSHNSVLEAKWHLKPTERTITYSTNGGEEIAPVKVKCADAYTLPTPKKEGYQFVYWFDEGGHIVTDVNTLVCEDVTLMARWKLDFNATYDVIDLDTILDSLNLQKQYSNYKPNDDAINVYLFYGSGCPHCHEFLKFISSIVDEYGQYFNFMAFEVWGNTNNSELMHKVGTQLNTSISGVPFIVIGDKTFRGYAQYYDDDIKKAIKNAYEASERYDVLKEIEKKQ